MVLRFNALGEPPFRVDNPDSEFLAKFPHEGIVRQFGYGHLELFSYVALCFAYFHTSGHLHAGHQISGGSHSAHARSHSVSNGYASGITVANLQSVQAR